MAVRYKTRAWGNFAAIKKIADANRWKESIWKDPHGLYRYGDYVFDDADLQNCLSWSLEFPLGERALLPDRVPEYPDEPQRWGWTYSFKAVFTTMKVKWGAGTTGQYVTDAIESNYTSDGVTVETITHEYEWDQPFPLIITGNVLRIEAGATQQDKNRVAAVFDMSLPGYVGNGGMGDPWSAATADSGEFNGCTNMIIERCRFSDSVRKLVGTFRNCGRLEKTTENIVWPVRLQSMHRVFEYAVVGKMPAFPTSVKYLDNVFAYAGMVEELGWPAAVMVDAWTPRQIRLGATTSNILTCESVDLDELYLWELLPDTWTADGLNLSAYRELTGVPGDPSVPETGVHMRGLNRAAQVRKALAETRKYKLDVIGL